ncbi:MAG: ABC transporter ATP-binding protein [Polyangiaceae bacterium]
MSFLALAGLKKTYGDGTHAVRGMNLSVERGEFIVLLGPSGCGKTTTLRMVAGLEHATGGSIGLDGSDVTALRPSQRDVGMVFQFYALYPHLTVRDNIAFPLRAAGLSPSEIRARVDGLAERMDLDKLLSRYPRQLSGGDQQKVSLARAIVRRPAIYLMDEPLGTLDADQRLAMREIIRAEQMASKVTTLYVTHDQEEAMSLADRIVVMEGGRIRQVGTPAEVYDRPADLFVAAFVGSPTMNFISGHVADGSGKTTFVSESGQMRIELPFAHRSGPARLGVRCEHVHEESSGPLLGNVLTEEYMGNASHVHVQTAVGRLIVRSSDGHPRKRGSELRLRLDPAQISVFDVATEKRL